jgi:asparagine synthase (glutamine-hydrolysing)
MSAIAGILHLDGPPVEPRRIQRMTDALANRGPDAADAWIGDGVGLGYRAFWTTPEAARERQPLHDPAASLAICFDGRLDNREELAALLDAAGTPSRDDTDAEIALRAYQAWGEPFASRLLGDFALAIWDAPRHVLVCARDIFGTRPLYYHFVPGKMFAFASTPDALFAGSVLPRQVDEARIADYLVSELEGIDKTSTFYRQVFRLPPAHTATISPAGLSLKPYWRPQAQPALQFVTNEDYESAFLEVFGKAVECRLRGGGMVGSMLSGGMDSSSIVGVARKLRIDAGGPPLRTFSVTRDKPADCPETQAIHEMLELGGLDAATLSIEQLAELEPELTQQTWHLEEPYDYHMIVPRSLSILARRQGVRVMLDGIDGDSVLSAGAHLARQLRRGEIANAWRNARELHRIYPDGPTPASQMIHAGSAAWMPASLRQALRPWYRWRQHGRYASSRLLRPDFAARIDLRERIARLADHGRCRNPLDRGADIAGLIDHPYVVCAVERYERVAAGCGLESRHPFLDRRVVEFCMRLPDTQKSRDGWTKSILRRAMSGYLPESVRWRRDKEHLGEALTLAYARRIHPEIGRMIAAGRDLLGLYVNLDELQKCQDTYQSTGSSEAFWQLYAVALLARWLQQQSSC